MRVSVFVFSSTLALAGSVAFAGPLQGVERNIEKNGAMSLIEGGDQDTYAATEGRDVLLGDDTIGVRNGKGGVNASENSVVGPWESSGCSGSTRVDLPGGGGSDC